MVGEKLEAGVPAAVFLVLAVLAVFLVLVAAAILDLGEEAAPVSGGLVIILAAFGVGLVVHCHNPSADTQA